MDVHYINLPPDEQPKVIDAWLNDRKAQARAILRKYKVVSDCVTCFDDAAFSKWLLYLIENKIWVQ